MDVQSRFDLITKNLEEVLTQENLMHFLEAGIPLKHYIGFEISGHVHLGTGLVTGLNLANFQKAGVNCSIYLANWHAWINNKLGGTLEGVKLGTNYFKESLIAAFKCCKVDIEKINFVSGDELYHNNDEYWQIMLDVSKKITLSRVLRSIPILGRKSSNSMPFAYCVYAPMQVADIFVQDITLTHSGIDQRKAHVIALDVAKKLEIHSLKYKNEVIKPVALHQPLALGLQKPLVWPIPKEKLQESLSELKMSKSVKGSSIFVFDSPEEIKKKINNAFCLEKEINFNPIINWVKHFVFNANNFLEVERLEKFGGNKTYYSFQELEVDFSSGKLHPLDLKNALSNYLIDFLEPARNYFKQKNLYEKSIEINKLISK